MQRPSKKWKSNQLAVLESIENWLLKRLSLCSVVHAGALGYFTQWWLSQYFGSSFQLASGYEFFVLLSIVLLFSSWLVGIFVVHFIIEIRERMDRYAKPFKTHQTNIQKQI